MSTRAIEFPHEDVCDSCGRSGAVNDNDFYLDVREVEANERGDGWTARGEGVSRCRYCGAVVRVIIHRVPLEIHGLPCSRCHETVDYQVQLRCVATEGRRFTFTASLTCPACSQKSVFRKLIESLGQIRRIKVGPTGVELDLESDQIS
jgi:hypothetical protein